MQAANKLAPGAFTYSAANSARFLYRPRESVTLLEDISPDSPCNNVTTQRFMLAESYHQLRDHVRELEVARLARQHADGLETLRLELRARVALRQTSAVTALLDTALSYPRTENESPGRLMLLASEEFRAHGALEASTVVLDRAITWYRSRPADEVTLETDLFPLAEALYVAGGWDEADSLFRRIAAEEPRHWSEVQGFLGASAVRRGDHAGAQRILATLDHLRRSGERPVSEVFYAEARIKTLLGDREGAVSLLRDWIGGQGFDLHTAIDFESLRDYPPFREFVRPKG
jgi:hypothetical protein